MAVLRIWVDKSSADKTLQIGETGMVIGRSPECDVVLDDPMVSRKHAVIRRVGRDFYVTDSNSRNKTYLNGRALVPDRPELLRDGDTITIGSIAMVFHLHDLDDATGHDLGTIKDGARDQGSGEYVPPGRGAYVPSGPERHYPLWFGTNRRPADVADPALVFTRDDDQALHYGACVVSVPISHKIGSIGSPGWKRWLTGVDDRLKLISLERVAAAAFWASAQTALANRAAGSRDAVVFIHGFNVSFEEAAVRAAQIGFDLNVRGIMAFYSWPSKGSALPLDYTADEATIEASEPFVAEFLARFAEESSAERVHVIAHSMGNRALLRSMQRITSQASRAGGPLFGHLVLAAPDIDARVFRELAKVYAKVATRTTLYASSKDRALASSGIVHDHPRAGYTPPLTVIPSIDTIEVSSVDLTFLGHGYFAEARDLLHDMHDLLINNLPPDRRMGLRSIVDAAGQCSWVIDA
jgi:esterase/lipase superfamily enzyme